MVMEGKMANKKISVKEPSLSDRSHIKLVRQLAIYRRLQKGREDNP